MLRFYPLYWVYHDCWQFIETYLEESQEGEAKPQPVRFDHAGHVHFFMPEYSTLKNATQQAYTGTQVYRFQLDEKWGPNSSSPNQVRSCRVVGRPMWYFHIDEYWRRIYLQPWDQEDYIEKHVNHPERIGVKYDASLPCHSFGPFREGGGIYFFNTEMNRTLPVEYWLDEEKTWRQHFLRTSHYLWDETTGEQTWRFDRGTPTWNRRGRGKNWNGDNLYDRTDDLNQTYSGCYEREDLVKMKAEVNGVQTYAYFRNRLSSIKITKGESFLPNPTPGADEATLRREYLTYMDFFTTDSRGNLIGTKYTQEYARYREENMLEETQEAFDAFVETKQEEFEKNCLESDGKHYRYMNIPFDVYCEIWARLDREEIEKLHLNGDYPLMRDEIPQESPFGDDEDDPFHKDGRNVNPYDVYKMYFEKRETYTIPRERVAMGDAASKSHPRVRSLSDEDGARMMYGDNLYISPVIEYMKVTQKDWERLDEAVSADAGTDPMRDEDFGEGYSATVEIPYRINGEVQSPFSDDNRVVHPIGEYFHNAENKGETMHYALESYGEHQENDSEAIDSLLDRVKKYDQSAYVSWTRQHPEPTQEEKVAFFNENYADRPILQNENEGMFDSNNEWIDPITHDRPTRDQAEKDSLDPDKRTLRPIAVKWNNPGYRIDGTWVEQCLGAVVRAKARVILEDSLGYRWEEWVETTSSSSDTQFIGMTE